MKEGRVLLCFIILGSIGFFIFIRMYHHILPAASLNFKVSREQVKNIAKNFLSSHGYNVEGYLSSIIFDSDEEAAIYTEKQLGLSKANQLFRSKICVWYWEVRWFKPLQKEEFKVYVAPEGKVVGFEHIISEEEAGKRLTFAEAKKIAYNFFSQVKGGSLAQYKLVETRREELENRRDYLFIWQDKYLKIKEATYRIYCCVSGDKVTTFYEYLKLPENYLQMEEKITAWRNLLFQTATFFWVILFILLVIAFFIKLREKQIKNRFILTLGIILIVVSLLEGLNYFPLSFAQFDTSKSIASFIINFVMTTLLVSILGGMYVVFIGTTGEPFYREIFKKLKPLPDTLKLRYFSSKEFINSVIVGYSFAFMHLGYIVLFYLFCEELLGAWSPAESPYHNIVSTAIPWIFPLSLGLSAALEEEFFFRLFAISFLIKYLKNIPVAVLIPAIIWAFLHSSYRVEPVYMRGVELTIVGIMLGYIFIKYGIFGVIIEHYVYNAFLGSLPLLTSTSLYFKLSGIIVICLMLIPLFPATYGLLKKKKEEDITEDYVEEKLQEQKDELQLRPVIIIDKKEEKITLTEDSIKLLSKTSIVFLFIICSVLFILTLPLLNKYIYIPNIKVNGTKAKLIAEEYINSIGLSTTGFKTVINFNIERNYYHRMYLVRYLGIYDTNKLLLKENIPFGVWEIIWYKPLRIENISVKIDEAGKVAGFSRNLPEDATGKNLPYKEAKRLVLNFISSKLKINPAEYKLIDSSKEKLKNRTDYMFIFEKKGYKVGKQKLRFSVGLQGDQISHYSKFLKTPEEFIRGVTKTTAKDTIITWIYIIISLILLCLAVVIFFYLLLKEKKIRFKLPLIIATILVMMELINYINNLPLFMSEYTHKTAVPVSVYISENIINKLMEFLFIFLVSTVLIAFSIALLKQIVQFDEYELIKRISPVGWLQPNKEHYQACLLALLFFIAIISIDIIYTFLQEQLLKNTLKPSYLFEGEYIASFLPIIGLICDLLKNSISFLALFAIIVSLFVIIFKRIRWILLILALFVIINSIGVANNIYEFFICVGLDSCVLLLAVFAILKIAKFNVMTYLLSFWLICSITPAVHFISSSDAFIFYNGLGMIILAFLPFILIFIGRIKKFF